MAGVTIQELGLRFVDACMKLYWGSCWYPLLFAVGLICTLVLGRKRKSGIFIGYTVFLLLTVYKMCIRDRNRSDSGTLAAVRVSDHKSADKKCSSPSKTF